MIPFYNIVTALLGVGTAAVILYLVRKDRLSVNYTLWWGFLAVALLIGGFFPRMIDMIGNLLGVNYPPILIVIIGICMIFIKLLFMDLHRSKHEQQIKILTQRIALYEKEQNNND